MRKLLGLVLGVLLVAVGQASAATAAAAPGCEASVGVVWTPAGQRPLRAEAFSHGPSCDKAIVVLTVRGSDGKPLWVDARVGQFVMLFAGVKNVGAIKTALGDWIRQNHQLKTAASLPSWPPGAQQPASGEFPFLPDEAVDRDFYESARRAKLPLFCYVQGMESMACVVLKDGGMTKLGVQLFPG
jgi:hypothetical protein